MRFSRRTRYIVGVLFFAGLGSWWYWFFSSTPRRTFWYFTGFSIALVIVFEGLARRVLPRSAPERILLELLFAVLTMIAANWFWSVLPAH
jgi:uncharacterized membrane protein YhaH (DUF805 family)